MTVAILTHRVFRLFISSTFSDFVVEREALQTRVFPELEKFCAERGARFQAVDLRWGITEEAQQEHDTMRICLEEVRRSQELSPRPNFAVLLGDRYGWEPVPARIPLDHWNRLLKAASPADRSTIRSAYEPDADRNAIPPMMWLKKRRGEWASGQSQELATRDSLRRAADRAGFTGDERLPYFASATHQEIALGALAGVDTRDHVHVYVRHIENVPQEVSAGDFIDWDATQGQLVLGARMRLRALEGQLRDRLGDKVHDLRTGWRDGAADPGHIAAFCDAFYQHQVALIDGELQAQGQATEFDERERAHAAFAQERSRVFAGRKPLLRRLDRYLNGATKASDPAAPLVLIGAGGSGKSALLARAVQIDIDRDAAQTPRAVVIARFIGGVPGTESLMGLLGALNADLAQRYGQPQPPAPENAKELAKAFEQALGYATAQQPLHLFLDALDQLDSTDSAWMLEWLPRQLPPHVRLVASVRPGNVEQAARRRFAQGVVDVPVMTAAEGEAMLKAWLADKRTAWFNAGIAPGTGRRLTAPQRQAVLQAFAINGSALWLKLAYEEASTWPSWQPAGSLPTSVEGLIEHLINHRLLEGENHPKQFTQRALAYLTAGRFGLAEDELARALGTDPQVRQEFEANERTQRKWEHPQLLPPILWSRLYFDLQPYLGLARVDGALLMRWFHREFKEVVGNTFLATPEARDLVHGHLATTFVDLERAQRPGETNDDALLRATDAGGQQVSAALRRVMEQPWQLAKAGLNGDLEALLTDFGFCMGKCAANRAEDLVDDFIVSEISLRGHSLASTWRRFVQAQAHLLRRGVDSWPSHKILLQVASEHADNSPITLAADTWLQGGFGRWLWLKADHRPKEILSESCTAVLEGHEGDGNIRKIWVIPSGKLISAFFFMRDDKTDFDGELRVWDIESGCCQAILDTGCIGILPDDPCNVVILPDDRAITWADGTANLTLWNLLAAKPLVVLEALSEIVGVIALPTGIIISWHHDCSLRTWNSADGAPITSISNVPEEISGVCALGGDRVLFWAGNTLQIWDILNDASTTRFDGHSEALLSAVLLTDGRVLSWSRDNTLRIWNLDTGNCEAIFAGHAEAVACALELPDGRIISWSSEDIIRIWNSQTGDCDFILQGHFGGNGIGGVLVLSGERVVSWSNGSNRVGVVEDTSLRIWDTKSGACLRVLTGHSHCPNEVVELPDGKIVSCAQDGARVWDLLRQCCLFFDSDAGAALLPGFQIVTQRKDHTLSIWDSSTGNMIGKLVGHTDVVSGIELLGPRRYATRSKDNSLRIWDINDIFPSLADPEATYQIRIDVRASWSLDDAKVAGGYEVKGGYSSLPDEEYIEFLSNMRAYWSDRGASIRIYNITTDADIGLLDENCPGGDLLAAAVLERSERGRHFRGISINHVQHLSDGRILAWYENGVLGFWDAHNISLLAVMRGNREDRNSSFFDGPRRAAILLSNNRAVTFSKSSRLHVWDLESGRCIVAFDGHGGWVQGALVCGEEQLLSWSTDFTLRRWNINNGSCEIVFNGHSDSVVFAQLTPEMDLVSVSKDRTLRLWSLESGACIDVLDIATWLEGNGFPGRWLPYAHFVGVIQNNEWCAQAIGRRVTLRNSQSGEQARWHSSGQAHQLMDVSGDGKFSVDVGGKRINFQCMRGFDAA